jgi:hypothetical protein
MSRLVAFRGVFLTLLLWSLAGCETARMTLAQELAWARWEKCRVSGVSMTRIEPGGRIWVTYMADHTSALREWRECDRKAAAEQGQKPSATSQPYPASTVAAPIQIANNGPIYVPVWKIGNEWAYRSESPNGTGTFVWSVDRIESLEGRPHYVVKTGSREIFYRVADLAFSQETVDKALVRQVTPSDWRWVAFPLTPGKSWDMKFHETRPADRQTDDIERNCAAEAEETITVPAGIFSTVRVLCKNSRNGAWVITVWYSSQVGHLVREESAVTGGKRVRELISYRLR